LNVPNDDPKNVIRDPPFKGKLARKIDEISGATTVNGSAPRATPYSAVPGFVIAAPNIEPTLPPLACRIAAATLTTGDVWSPAIFCKANVTSQAVPAIVPVDAAVSTSCPVLAVFVHAPEVPRRPDVDATVKAPLSAVCEPVSPEIVTVEPAFRS